MPMTAAEKAAAVRTLTTNCACWKGGEATLNGLPDETLSRLAADAETATQNAIVVNSLRTDLDIPPELTGNAMAEMVKGKLTGAPVAPGGKQAKAKAGAEDDEAEEYVDPAKKTATQVANKWGTDSPMKTFTDYLRDHGTPDEVATWNAAVRAEKREKLEIVQRLVANVSDPAKRKERGNALLKKSLAELEQIADLLPPTANAGPTRRDDVLPPARFDAAGDFDFPVTNKDGGDDLAVNTEDVLTPARVDYSGLSEFKPAPVK